MSPKNALRNHIFRVIGVGLAIVPGCSSGWWSVSVRNRNGVDSPDHHPPCGASVSYTSDPGDEFPHPSAPDHLPASVAGDHHAPGWAKLKLTQSPAPVSSRSILFFFTKAIESLIVEPVDGTIRAHTGRRSYRAGRCFRLSTQE